MKPLLIIHWVLWSSISGSGTGTYLGDDEGFQNILLERCKATVPGAFLTRWYSPMKRGFTLRYRGGKGVITFKGVDFVCASWKGAKRGKI